MNEADEDPGFEGKVVWPIKEGQRVGYNDAYATLFDISEAQIEVSYYHQNGEDLTGNLEVHLSGWQSYDEAPGTYFAKPLKQALEEVLEKLVDSNSTDEELAEWGDDEEWKSIKERTLECRPYVRRSLRLTELLLEAYAKWDGEQ
jgi:hypothetical protein